MRKIYSLDIGNTAIKGAVTGDDGIAGIERFATLEEALDRASLAEDIEALVYCCVRRSDEETSATFHEWSQRTGHPVVGIKGDSDLPLGVRYAPPADLGPDRISAAVGAAMTWRMPCLVADAGTALTIDLVADWEFQGGTISPGIRMRFETLGSKAQLLPEVNAEGDLPVLGNSTRTAIRAGVVRGAAAEIEVAYLRAASRYPGLRLILTGGDGPLLEHILKERNLECVCDPLLVFRGLDASYKYLRDVGKDY